MKNLREFVNEYIKDYNDSELLNESFQSSIMNDLEKQLKSVVTSEYYRKYYSSKKPDYSFKKFILPYATYMRWDKLDDSKMQKCDCDEKLVKRVKSACRANAKESLILIVRDKTDSFYYAWINTVDRTYVYLPHDEIDNTYKYGSNTNSKIDTIGEVVKAGKYAYVIDKTDPDIQIKSEDDDSRNTRWHRRQGVIKNGDKDFYKELAKSNIERYKKIIKANNTKKLADSDIVENIRNTFDMAYDYMEELLANPYAESSKYYALSAFINSASAVLKDFSNYVESKRDTVRGYSYNDAGKKLQLLNDRCKDLQSKVLKLQ